MNINILMISIPVFHINIYILYKLLKLCFENIDRIDELIAFTQKILIEYLFDW